MKRAVDYVVAHHSHFIIDADRAYPLGGVNPRPPLFTWSLALGGLAIHWITGISLEQAVWFSVAGMPAILVLSLCFQLLLPPELCTVKRPVCWRHG